MKNLVNRINLVEEEVEVSVPVFQLEGYDLLTVEERAFVSDLSPELREEFIADTLHARAMDEALAKCFA